MWAAERSQLFSTFRQSFKEKVLFLFELKKRRNSAVVCCRTDPKAELGRIRMPEFWHSVD